MRHRYEVGQVLAMRSDPGRGTRPAGLCEVVARLPHDAGPLLYRVQSVNEHHQRVVAEADLTATSTVRAPAASAEAVFDIAVTRRPA